MTSKRSDEHKVGALEPINPPERDKLRSKATIDGYQYIELPAKVVWTIKPDKTQTQDCGMRQSDPGYLRQNFYHPTWILQCYASYSPGEHHHQTTSWHHWTTAAFLNAELPPGRIVVLRPPSILYRLGLIPQGFCWRVHRAIYGLREAPSLWQVTDTRIFLKDERTSEMTKVKFKVQGETAKVIVSQVHQSLCMIVKERDLRILTFPSLASQNELNHTKFLPWSGSMTTSRLASLRLWKNLCPIQGDCGTPAIHSI